MELYNSSNKNIIKGASSVGTINSSKTIISPNIYDAYSVQNNISREIKSKSDIIGRIRTKKFRVRRDEILKFKKIGDMIISKAKREASTIFTNMIQDAQVEIVKQKVASKMQGYKEGFDEGKREAIKEIEGKKDEMMESALLFYKNAQNEADEYIKSKENDIKEMIFNTISKVIRRQLNDEKVLNDIIYNSIKNIRDKMPVLIKCNEMNYKDISSEVINWKEKSGILGDFHVIISKDIDAGEFLIERNGGIIKYDVNDNLNIIRKIIFGEEE